MKKKIVNFVCLVLFAITIISFNGKVLSASANYSIYLGGDVYGFDLQTKGVTVVGFCDVITQKGLSSPAKDAGIKIGDIIVSVNENEVNDVVTLEKSLLNELNVISVYRDEKVKSFILYPAISIDNQLKIGVFAKNCISGIGTVTYYDSNGKFGALGHEVCDYNSNPAKVIGGIIYQCSINNIIKGARGKAGELQGIIKRSEKLGKINKSQRCGIFGDFNEISSKNNKKIEICKENEVEIGSAKAFSKISGKGEYYDVSIIKIDNSTDTKNYVIKIEDSRLLDLTGGIVQGMSGTPLLQNGKLIGAITHVFINDPTRGFGININNMLNA